MKIRNFCLSILYDLRNGASHSVSFVGSISLSVAVFSCSSPPRHPHSCSMLRR